MKPLPLPRLWPADFRQADALERLRREITPEQKPKKPKKDTRW